MNLFADIETCLSVYESACRYMNLFVGIWICMSVYESVCRYMSLFVDVGICLSPNITDTFIMGTSRKVTTCNNLTSFNGRCGSRDSFNTNAPNCSVWKGAKKYEMLMVTLKFERVYSIWVIKLVGFFISLLCLIFHILLLKFLHPPIPALLGFNAKRLLLFALLPFSFHPTSSYSYFFYSSFPLTNPLVFSTSPPLIHLSYSIYPHFTSFSFPPFLSPFSPF